MLPIDVRHIRYNFGNSGTHKSYIVIHDTGNTSRGADDISHYNYFNGGVVNASAHYFVDKDSITETVDPNMDSWHCGDGGGAYGITNRNSIGIELCINSDGNYEQTFQNAVELTRYLMTRFGIPLDRVVRHYDASRKNCPASMSANNWANWWEFKNRVAGTNVGGTVINNGGNGMANLLKVGSRGDDVCGLQNALNSLGFDCGYVDGIFGNGTKSAVIAFQNAKGLDADGIVGQQTLNALGSALAQKNASANPAPINPSLEQRVAILEQKMRELGK